MNFRFRLRLKTPWVFNLIQPLGPSAAKKKNPEVCLQGSQNVLYERLTSFYWSSIGTNFTFFRILDRGRKLDFGNWILKCLIEWSRTGFNWTYLDFGSFVGLEWRFQDIGPSV